MVFPTSHQSHNSYYIRWYPLHQTELTGRTASCDNRSILSKCRNDRSGIKFQPSHSHRKESHTYPRNVRGLLPRPSSELLWILLVEYRNSSIPRQSSEYGYFCGCTLEIFFHENTVVSTEFLTNE